MFSYVDHVQITVRSLEASMRFYHGILGFQPVSRFEKSGPGILGYISDEHGKEEKIKRKIVFLKPPQGLARIELIEYDRKFPQRGATYGMQHLSITADDLEVAKAYLESRGVATEGIREGKESTFFFIQDPDKTPIQVKRFKQGLI